MNILTGLCIGLTIFVIPPIFAEAGVLGVFSNFFTSHIDFSEESHINSQNVALLQSNLSPNQKKLATAETSIGIVEGTSLLASASVDSDNSGDEKISTSDQISIYVVHKGDTLPAIAKMFGVNVNTIVWANDLKSKTIKEGQTLVILPISGVKHVVQSGDTLKSIASKYKGDLDEILQFNSLSKDSKLAVGDVIIIPDGEISAQASASKPNTGGNTKPNTSTPEYSGYYMRPIVGGVKTQGIHGHNGVDLASSFGSPILAAADGTVLVVKSSGWNGGYGSYIVLQHQNGTQTLYAHLSGVGINMGDSVRQGQIIGYMGNTGRATGVHLHFEVRGARNPF